MSPGIVLSLLILSEIWLFASLSNPAFASKSHHIDAERIECAIANKHANDKTYQDLETLIESDPDNVKARLLLADCYEGLGLPELALEQFQLAYQVAPHQPITIAALFNAQLKALHTNEAVQLLIEANKQLTGNPDLMVIVGDYVSTHNDKGMALLLYQRAARNKNIPIGFASIFANIELKQKNYQAALALAQSDLDRNNELASASKIKGLALCHMGNYSDAVEPLKLAFAKDPFNGELATAYTLSLLWTGHYSQALPAAITSLAFAQSQPDKAISKSVLIRILRKTKNLQWQKICDQAISQLPVDRKASFCFSLAEVFDACNMPEAAIEWYKCNLKLDVDNAQAWYCLANDLETYSHNYQEALNCYRKAQVLLPNNQYVKQRTWRLEDRLAIKSTDWSWQLKDWLAGI